MKDQLSLFQPVQEILVQNALDAGRSAPNPFQAISVLVQAAASYGRIRQEEQTRRAEIEAERQQILAHLQGIQDVHRQYLDLRFRERTEVRAALTRVLEAAVVRGDTDLQQKVVASLLALVASSPIDELRALPHDPPTIGLRRR